VKLSVTGRHMPITDVLRDYVTDKSERLAHYFENLQKVEVILNPERDASYSAEMVVHAPRHSVLVCHAGGKTATAAVDLVLEKMERLLTKHKEKLQKRNGRERTKRAARRGEEEVPAGDGFGDIWW
jgi:putative sigma-54 modulation protein